jgi:hypothetical protein
MSMEQNQKVIFGRDEICKAYGFGKQTFYWLLEKDAPIKRMGGRYCVHRESLDQFILLMTIEASPEKKRKKAAR